MITVPHIVDLNLTGQWRENGGRVWHCTQNGHHFTWTQEGTGRVATGIAVPKVNSSDFAVVLTFDNSVHWLLKPSPDHNQLHGPSDTFTRVHPLVAEAPFGGYQEKSGKIWQVTASSPSSFVLHNQQDGRNADGYFSRDPTNGMYTVFINFHNNGQDHLLKIVTNSLASLPLSNGDVFTKIY
ncbi:hypothetical protein FDP41_013414 [Naegleria fowleri]|uniref:Uncharacterized protein n=1 Tax=Naegleria fowleri TaxID=5763 RepID=A0A6A5C2W0_NAEFO|nr:uncharacterized protein FDP41_013414 [Naegleria fowleri]KAF0980200.1 hypothetical protein FDP41_013414 [Naegleria fowleri]CAG4709464.1 unnamed protein product [Naegleria fowleri]